MREDTDKSETGKETQRTLRLSVGKYSDKRKSGRRECIFTQSPGYRGEKNFSESK